MARLPRRPAPAPSEPACTHAMLREMNGGECPVCGGNNPPAPSVIVPIGTIGHGAVAPVAPNVQHAPAVQHEPARPPPVECPPAPGGEVHEPARESALPREQGPAYMRQALTRLTRAEATALLLKLQRRRMIADFRDFVRGAWRTLEGENPLEWNPHHDAFCMHFQIMIEEWYLAGLRPEQVEPTLDAWERAGRPYVASYREHWAATEHERAITGRGYKQRTNDLVVNVGPISLKSRIFMVFGPAWVWTWVPSWEVFCSSGTPSNVDRDSMACRDLVTSPWYREAFAIDWTIRDDLDRVSKWGIGRKRPDGTWEGLGSREARGAGANVVGIHADALLLDDPDDSAKVWSDAARRDIWLFWLALGNRLKDPKRPVRIVIQQNLHEEDLSMRLIAVGVARLAIPVEYDPTRRKELVTAPYGWEDWRTEVGELIHVDRFPLEALNAERVRLGTHGFEAQYNCNPRPLEGGMIKRGWWRFFRIEDMPIDDDMRPRPTGCVTRAQSPASLLKRVQGLRKKSGPLDLDWLTLTVDATFGSLKETASAVGLLCVGGKLMRRYVFDDVTAPMTFHSTCAAIKSMIRRWPAKRVLIELKANGAAVIEELKKQLEDGAIIGPDGQPIVVVVEEVTPEGGKESRAAAMVPAIEAGTVYLLDGAPWLEAFIGEVCVFPHAKRDDRVDALSQLMTYYRAGDVTSSWAHWMRGARA